MVLRFAVLPLFGSAMTLEFKTTSVSILPIMSPCLFFRKNLQARGSELVVRIGKPESVFVELVNMIGVEATYARREVSRDEVKAAL
ncbi:hypothetical protein LguiB_015554 [Lonicera macranthoides]